jgi:hypothetical protein
VIRRFLGLLGVAAVAASAAPALAAGENVVSAFGETTPTKLRRSKDTPATLRVGFTSEATDSPTAPGLAWIGLQISRNISLHTAGLPSCPLKDLYSPMIDARQACAASLVGHGSVTAEIAQPNQGPVTVDGQLLAFYASPGGVPGSPGRVPGVFAQVTTPGPVALTFVVPFRIWKAQGPFSTRLSVRNFLPAFECVKRHPGCDHNPFTFQDIYSHISRFEMSLHRRFFHAGARHSFVTARCPAPSNSRQATFPIARVFLAYFSTIEERTATATGRCEAPAE